MCIRDRATGIDVLAATRSGGGRRHEEGRNGCESSNARSLLGAGLPRSEGDSQYHPAGDAAVEAQARDAAVESRGARGGGSVVSAESLLSAIFPASCHGGGLDLYAK